MEGDFVEYDETRPPLNRMIVAVMALIGLLISLYTLLHKLQVLKGPMFCGNGGCEFVQESPFAVQLGIPVPAWGLVGYGAMLVIAIMGLQSHVHERWVSKTLLAGGIFAAAFTLYLSYFEAFVLHTWCRWCLGSAAVVTVMLIAVLPEIKRLREKPAGADRADGTRL